MADEKARQNKPSAKNGSPKTIRRIARPTVRANALSVHCVVPNMSGQHMMTLKGSQHSIHVMHGVCLQQGLPNINEPGMAAVVVRASQRESERMPLSTLQPLNLTELNSTTWLSWNRVELSRDQLSLGMGLCGITRVLEFNRSIYDARLWLPIRCTRSLRSTLAQRLAACRAPSRRSTPSTCVRASR